jgi:hypothetical protein
MARKITGATAAPRTVSVPVRIELEGAGPDDKLDLLQAVVFDRLGQPAAATRLKVSRGKGVLLAEGQFSAAPEQLASARVVVAPLPPGTGQDLPPDRETLERQFGGYTEPLQLNLRQPRLDLRLPRPYWEGWTRLCACWIRGRLVKRVQLTGGDVLELPICHARVTVCEVDRFSLLLEKLPLPDLYRLRDELLHLVERPIPIPLPEPDPWFAPLATSQVLAYTPPRAALRAPVQPVALKLSDTSPQALRADLVAQFELFRPWLCGLTWLEPWFVYTRQCLAPVMTDEMGRFSVLYVHDCADTDQPDLHIRAEQLIGGDWITIHNPPVRCHTIWNYPCGDELTVVVTDERAQPCVPDVPVDPPAGVDRWVMPMAIGSCWVRGTAGAAAPAGWVRPDGLLDHGGIVDAPFGGTLGFRQQHSLNIPDANPGQPALYRWSWRRHPTDAWIHMTAPVSRTYVRDLPGPAVQFPSVQLGPRADDAYRFKPALFDVTDPEWGISTAGDPGGTSYYWPVDNGIGDIYAARWTTPGSSDALAAPALAGSYQVRLEVLDSARNVLLPGPATFQFVVPSVWDGTTLDTRAASPSEIVDGGFVFTVHVDNSRCDAGIDAPLVVGGAGVDDCGFLRYTPGSTVRLAFDALHPAQRATFSLGVVRGALGVGAAGAGGEVGALSSGAYSGNGAGRFTHDFPVADLMGPLPGHPGSCDNAAFAVSLRVWAKAHDGNTRIHAYDDSALRAFALAL